MTSKEGKAAFDAYQATLTHDKAIELEALRGICTLERAVPKPRLSRSVVTIELNSPKGEWRATPS